MLIVDSILPRWRTMPASPSSRSTSRVGERGDRVGIEARERAAVALALVEDGAPAQSRLRAFEREQLEQRGVVVRRHAPLVVVVGDHERLGARPLAPRWFGHRAAATPRRTRGRGSSGSSGTAWGRAGPGTWSRWSGSRRVLGRGGHAQERDLPDLHARVERDRQVRDVRQLEREVPIPTGVDESRGAVDEQTEAAKR